jgi:hypothetical protein
MKISQLFRKGDQFSHGGGSQKNGNAAFIYCCVEKDNVEFKLNNCCQFQARPENPK